MHEHHEEGGMPIQVLAIPPFLDGQPQVWVVFISGLSIFLGQSFFRGVVFISVFFIFGIIKIFGTSTSVEVV